MPNNAYMFMIGAEYKISDNSIIFLVNGRLPTIRAFIFYLINLLLFLLICLRYPFPKNVKSLLLNVFLAIFFEVCLYVILS